MNQESLFTKGIVKANKNNPNKKVVFVNGILHFFEHYIKTTNYNVGDEIPVILTRVQYSKNEEGKIIFSEPIGSMVIPVDLEIHELIEVPRFKKNREKKENIPSTYSQTWQRGREIFISAGWSRPSTAGAVEGESPTIFVWVLKEDLDNPEKKYVRIIGLNSLSDRKSYTKFNRDKKSLVD